MIRFSSVIVLLIITLVLAPLVSARSEERQAVGESGGALIEVRDKQRALLLVFRSAVLDVGNNERSIIEQVLKADPHPKGRYQWVYSQLAKKLNSYIRKYRSLTAAQDLSDADYVIYFNLIEYRRILNSTYPYGELFVIVKGTPETQKPPRIVWRAKKILWAGDAISSLIKELKTLRGET